MYKEIFTLYFTSLLVHYYFKIVNSFIILLTSRRLLYVQGMDQGLKCSSQLHGFNRGVEYTFLRKKSKKNRKSQK